jgi:fido (protein-threonine AMPylation protein)
MDRPPKPTGDLTELRAIHRHLFQDLYDWAGQVSTVDIRKNVEGAGFFLPSGMIERASAFAAGELHADNTLCGLDRAHFIDRLAYPYDQVNYIHPFREGNGRVQRVLWNRIALAARWQLDRRNSCLRAQYEDIAQFLAGFRMYYLVLDHAGHQHSGNRRRSRHGKHDDKRCRTM